MYDMISIDLGDHGAIALWEEEICKEICPWVFGGTVTSTENLMNVEVFPQVHRGE